VPPKKPQTQELEALLGYNFRDKILLREALTHSSARAAQGGHDNERLEFLGDRVLGFPKRGKSSSRGITMRSSVSAAVPA